MTEWTKYSETKPEDNQKCLFWNGKEIQSGRFRYCLCKYVDGMDRSYVTEYPQTCGCNGVELAEVTHWMPWPEVPYD